MIQYLFHENVFIYIYGSLCGLGLLFRFILELVHIYLISESDSLGTTKNKALKHMKLKFETCYKLKIGVNNVDTFVDKNLLRYRFCGVLLSTWESLSGQALLLSFLIVPVSTVFGVIFKCGQDEIIYAGAVGILVGSILIFVDRVLNLATKKKLIRLNLMDYLENFCKVRLEQETFQPELLNQYRREYFKVADGVKQVSASEDTEWDESGIELSRRRETRQRKELEKKALAIQREEEQKRIEELRKEEEKNKLEERKKLAAKRREEELLKLEEEREALERRRAEIKKRAEEKKSLNEKRQQKTVEDSNVQPAVREEYAAARSVERSKWNESPEKKAATQKVEAKSDNKVKIGEGISAKESDTEEVFKINSPQEERLIEDILKEFFT